MRGVDHGVQQIIERGIDVEHIHAGRGHHHIPGCHARQAQHAFQHHAAFGVDDVAVFCLGQRGNQLFGRVRTGVQHFSQFLQQASLVLHALRRFAVALGGLQSVGRVRIGHRRM